MIYSQKFQLVQLGFFSQKLHDVHDPFCLGDIMVYFSFFLTTALENKRIKSGMQVFAQEVKEFRVCNIKIVNFDKLPKWASLMFILLKFLL
jgi:hypothetical protein